MQSTTDILHVAFVETINNASIDKQFCTVCLKAISYTVHLFYQELIYLSYHCSAQSAHCSKVQIGKGGVMSGL